MTSETLLRLLTVGLGVLVITWHWQRCINKLRDEMISSHEKLRDAMSGGHEKLRYEMSGGIDALRVLVMRNGERIARIEGRLEMGTPDTVIDRPREATRAGPGG